MIEIKENEVAYKRKVGKLGNSAVIQVGLKGGLNLIVVMRGGRSEILGVGPHQCLSRHLARKKEKDIEWVDLSKSDYVAPEHFAFCLPQYEALTDQLRAAQGLK